MSVEISRRTLLKGFMVASLAFPCGIGKVIDVVGYPDFDAGHEYGRYIPLRSDINFSRYEPAIRECLEYCIGDIVEIIPYAFRDRIRFTFVPGDPPTTWDPLGQFAVISWHYSPKHIPVRKAIGDYRHRELPAPVGIVLKSSEKQGPHWVSFRDYDVSKVLSNPALEFGRTEDWRFITPKS